MEINIKKQQFTQIYKKEADAVFRYVLLRVSNKEEVLDIVQDTFTRFWQSWNKETIEYPRSFIFTVARNRIIDWYRKKKPQSLEAMVESEDGQVFDIPDEKMQTDIKLSAEASVVLKALDKLSTGYREAVYLRFVEDLTLAEIAKILATTPNAVSIRLNRGLDELRNHLKIDINNY